jgi:hypothetical protein
MIMIHNMIINVKNRDTGLEEIKWQSLWKKSGSGKTNVNKSI